MVASHRRRRHRHENTYNFAQNFDQNRLLGKKLCQNENRSIKKFEIDFSDFDFPIFHTIFNENFRFFSISKIFEKLKFLIFDFFISKNFHWKLYEKWENRDRKKSISKKFDGPIFILT